MTGCVYIAQGNRLLKIGRSKNPMRRKYFLEKEFKKYGDTITRFEVSETVNNEFSTELVTIGNVEKIRERFSGREWFKAGDFDEVVSLLEKAVAYVKIINNNVMTTISKEERDAQIEKRAIERQKQKADAAARRIEYETQKRAQKLRRNLRRMEVDCRAMWDRIYAAATHDGAVRCEDLRPDVNWAILRGTAAQQAGGATCMN